MTRTHERPVFACVQCGDCCAGKGGIFVRPEEVVAMAGHLKMSPEDFQRRYLEASSLGPRLTTDNGVCIFLVEGNNCRVHPVKPFICRQWPFLPALLADPEELEQAKGACPGINPDCRHEDFVDAARRWNGSST
jgi:Fe-S-cluster containining protein